MSDDSDDSEAKAETEEVQDDAEAEAEAQAEDEAESEGLQDGDVIQLAYTARTVEDGQLVDTTDEDVAEEEGVAEQGEFAPRTIVLGAGHLFDEVEQAIIGHEVGESGSVTVEEPFGEYDQEEVRTVSADKIPEDDRYPGAQVQIDGEQGRLETIIGGRARVDFNHPIAGEDIEYEFEVLGEVEDTLEKAKGLLDMYLDIDLEMWVQTDEVEEEQLVEPDEEDVEEAEDEEFEPEYETVTVDKESLYIEATPQLTMNQGWMMQKQQISQQVLEHTGLDRIVVQEILDGQPAGMGMGGMMGGMPGAGGADDADIEEALEEMDVDADEIVEELDEGELDVEE